MKNIALSLSLFGLFALATSCDKIEKPYPKAFSQGAVCSTEEFEIVTSAPARVLIEDYTGHQCGNCPDAAVLADDIHEDYPENTVTMAVHAGFFARTRPSGKFSTDFTNPTSVKWDTDFGVSLVGNPNGMINRRSVEGNEVVGLGQWRSTVEGLIGKSAMVEINLAGTVDNTDSTICGQIFIQPLNNLDESLDLGFNLVLLEDSIVDWQKDYRRSSEEGEDDEFYVHNHVLRQSFVGPDGVNLDLVGVRTDSYLSFGYKIPQNPIWRTNKLTLVGFVFDRDTKEILQVRKLKL